jgi:DNA end-binding protein Ku
VHFRLLHAEDQTPIEQHMLHPVSEERVDHDVVQRGFPLGDGRIVVVRDEELEAVEPPSSRTIDVLRFVPLGAIEHHYYDRPYYLGPDGADGAYAALCSALRKEGVEAVTRWTMRKQGYFGALRARPPYLLMTRIHFADDIVDAKALPQPVAPKVSARERQMAEQLLRIYEAHFDPQRFEEHFRTRVLELIQAKTEGRPLPLKKARPTEPHPSLGEALRQSLVEAKKRRRVA